MTMPTSTVSVSTELEPAGAEGGRTNTEARLREVIEAALRDLQAGRPDLPAVASGSVLDRDLGLDSLARMEVLLRIERAFACDLPPDTLQRAETVGDLWTAVQHAKPAGPRDDAGAQPRLPSQELPRREAEPPASTLERTATLVEVLDWHCREHPDHVQHVVLQDDGEQPVTYRQLADGAARVAAGLQRRGLAPRQCIAIMLPTSVDYFRVYLGILLAGGIPVPIYPPARASQLEDHVLRHAAILRNAGTVGMVTVDEARGVARLLRAQVSGLRWIATPPQLAEGGGTPAPVALRADDIAFIQYTSGSTGQPKGVALTHSNLLANIRAMAVAVRATPRDVFVSWLPLYHDMGLIGAWLGSLYVGYRLVVMSPLAFLSRPLRWLQAIHRWRGTLSAGPNFAYELCLRRLEDADLAGLDLSCWRLAFNGAEAVSPDTVQRFSARLAACGLRPEAVAPVYGLAEASVGLLFPPLGRAVVIDTIDRETFARDRRALPVPPEHPGALRFVACGRVIPGHAVRIVDDAGHDVAERVEGRLEFRGPSATRGYYRNPEQTARLIHDGWLDTGDRAYTADGDVFVTGRVKDIVIRGGRNLYPQEIEDAVGALDGIRKGCVAVFGSPDPASGTERLVVMAETRQDVRGPRAIALQEAVMRAVVAAIGEPPDRVVLVPPHGVLKTSSGKVRRSACRERFESGVADGPAPASRQLMHLVWQALRVRVAAVRGTARDSAHAVRVVAAFLLFAPAAWLATMAARTPARAWALGHRLGRAWLGAAGVPLAVNGLERLPAGPFVLVCNHASYLDGLVVVSALPRPMAFVAKQELATQRIAGRYLSRLGALFVERFDLQRGVCDARLLQQAVQQQRPLAVFPEGTFRAAPGLLPFHLGAFLTAVRAGVPVVPMAIAGTRRLLPDGSWWPRRAVLRVEIGQALLPEAGPGDDLAKAASLRELARQAIVQALGDSDELA